MKQFEYAGRPKLLIKYILNNNLHSTDCFEPQELVTKTKELKILGVKHFTIYYIGQPPHPDI
jgi:hypothetical protein